MSTNPELRAEVVRTGCCVAPKRPASHPFNVAKRRVVLRCSGCKRKRHRTNVACLPCWRRLPAELRRELAIATSQDRKRAAARCIVEWLRANPDGGAA